MDVHENELIPNERNIFLKVIRTFLTSSMSSYIYTHTYTRKVLCEFVGSKKDRNSEDQ